MEAFSTVLKVFLEKHLIPTVIALVIGVIGFYYTPTDNLVLLKLGREWYVLLVAAIAFLVISLVIKVYHILQERRYYYSLQKRNMTYDKREEKKSLRSLWDQVDSLRIDDRKILQQFLLTDNAPIERGMGYHCSYDSLLGSNWVKSRDVQTKNGYRKQYILDEQIFQILKYSKEKYGRIGNFKEEV